MESRNSTDADGEPVMDAEEVVNWIRLLLDEPKYGWWFDPMCVAKALGFVGQAQMRRYVFIGKPLTIPLQKYASRQLRRIISGELVCVPGLKRGRQIGLAVLAANPKPIFAEGPKALGFMTIGRKGLKLNMIPAAPVKDQTRMPTFAEVMRGKYARTP